MKTLLENHHHHHIVPQARVSLTLSRHFSQSFIAYGRFSGPHPISSHSCWMHVRAGRPAFARLYVGVHRSGSLMSSSLLLQQCLACLVCLPWIVFVMVAISLSGNTPLETNHSYIANKTAIVLNQGVRLYWPRILNWLKLPTVLHFWNSDSSPG